MEFDAGGFGRRLKQYRIKNHLTQEELAEKINTATSSVSHLENGTHSPSLKTLISLCAVLEIGVDDLLADSLPAKSVYLDGDIAEQLADCSPAEKQIIADIVTELKRTLRAHA